MKNLIEVLAYVLKLILLGISHEKAINDTAKTFGMATASVRNLLD